MARVERVFAYEAVWSPPPETTLLVLWTRCGCLSHHVARGGWSGLAVVVEPKVLSGRLDNTA